MPNLHMRNKVLNVDIEFSNDRCFKCTAKVMIESLCPLVATVFQPILENDISSNINTPHAFTSKCVHKKMLEENVFCINLICLHILLQD